MKKVKFHSFKLLINLQLVVKFTIFSGITADSHFTVKTTFNFYSAIESMTQCDVRFQLYPRQMFVNAEMI